MPDESDSYEPDAERVQESANERRHERTQTVEDIAGRVGNMLEEQKYPVTSEELAMEYSDEVMDLPNETESVGSVFDRIVDERFESPDEAREALLNELSGQSAGPEEYNDGRSLPEIDGDDDRLDTA